MKILYLDPYRKSLKKQSTQDSAANDNIKPSETKRYYAYTTSGELLVAVNGNELKLVDSFGRCTCDDNYH